MKTIRNSEISLSERSVTGSANGYPEPYLGQFFYGFDNLEQAKKYAAETGGEVRIAEWRDGWSNCVLGGTPYEEFTPNTDDYGDNFQVVDNQEELRESAYALYNSILEADDEFAGYEDEVSAAKESGDNLFSVCRKVDWKKDSVILSSGDFYETVPKKSMVFKWDVRTVVIGVVVFEDQD